MFFHINENLICLLKVSLTYINPLILILNLLPNGLHTFQKHLSFPMKTTPIIHQRIQAPGVFHIFFSTENPEHFPGCQYFNLNFPD